MLTHPISVIVWFISLVGLFIWLGVFFRDKDRWMVVVGPATYFLNSALFYTFFLLGDLSVYWLNLWSSIVRLHSLILFIGLGYTLLTRRFTWTRHL